MTNKHHTTLYVGVTSNLINRIYQHKTGTFSSGFTAKYNCNELVFYKFFPRIEEAIAEEKRIKSGSRKKKIELINKMNNAWKDLADTVEN